MTGNHSRIYSKLQLDLWPELIMHERPKYIPPTMYKYSVHCGRNVNNPWGQNLKEIYLVSQTKPGHETGLALLSLGLSFVRVSGSPETQNVTGQYLKMKPLNRSRVTAGKVSFVVRGTYEAPFLRIYYLITFKCVAALFIKHHSWRLQWQHILTQFLEFQNTF